MAESELELRPLMPHPECLVCPVLVGLSEIEDAEGKGACRGRRGGRIWPPEGPHGGEAAQSHPACLLPRGHSGWEGPIFAQLSCPWGCRQVAGNRADFSHSRGSAKPVPSTLSATLPVTLKLTGSGLGTQPERGNLKEASELLVLGEERWGAG